MCAKILEEEQEKNSHRKSLLLLENSEESLIFTHTKLMTQVQCLQQLLEIGVMI